MDYCLTLENKIFLNEVISYFDKGLRLILEKISSNKRVFIDPCFGFSKTREQNHYLLSHMGELLDHYSRSVEICGIIYGVSKKSFLRFPLDINLKSKSELAVLANMQSILFYDLLQKSSPDQEIIFRVHDNYSLKALDNIKNCEWQVNFFNFNFLFVCFFFCFFFFFLICLNISS